MSSNVGLKALHEVLVQILAETKKQTSLLELLNSDSTSEWDGTDIQRSLSQSEDDEEPNQQDLDFVEEEEKPSKADAAIRGIRRPAHLGAGDMVVDPDFLVGGTRFLNSHGFQSVLTPQKANTIASAAPSLTGEPSHSQMEDQEAESDLSSTSRKRVQLPPARRSGASRSSKFQME